ncbi:hypothetical protein DVA86_03995 [Streptomyces armeniacus]|uniref:Uncharacterized protein n=1 Tax=Streptomyces armeniacus TaxID=83291 RepID=A0A345XJW5_9ACTN|nr:hypothetical protein [Streptomyces armeniacus]AXK31931.1 hypothetical protein DVA86_03995 [Streptomyces armeniacus]
MKSLLGALCFVLVSQGVGGLLHTFTDGSFDLWALTHRIGFLDGYEVYASTVLLVLGVAVGAAAEKLPKDA